VSGASPAGDAAPATPLRLAVLVGGGGRTLVNLARCIEAGTLDAEIALVIASRRTLAGVERAEGLGLPVEVVPRGEGPDADRMHDALTGHVEAAGADLVCCAGWLRWIRVDPPLAGRTINIHPALLPAFGGRGMYGRHVHEAVLAAGRRVSGCTVHLVDERYDHGPTILQRACPVLEVDDAAALAARVFAEECLAYPETIARFAAGRVSIEGSRVILHPPGVRGSWQRRGPMPESA